MSYVLAKEIVGSCVRVEVVLLAKKLRLAEIMCGHIMVNYKVVWILVIRGPLL